MASDMDKFIGLQPIKDYKLSRVLGSGKIGTVYLAERMGGLKHLLACKIIKEDKLRVGWEKELEKVLQLRGVDNVVQYHSHGVAFDSDNRPYAFVMFDYVNGYNLNSFIADHRSELNVPFIESIISTILNVLFACHSQGIIHGDLHAGNILISNPDPRIRNSRRKIFVADFGYGGSHNSINPKDDFQELANITQALLHELKLETLNARDRSVYEKLNIFASKRLRDALRTKNSDPDQLIREYDELRQKAEIESAAGMRPDEVKSPGDFLWAEAMGYRKEDWKQLFVPEFLAASDLLTKNNTILTGARGCGKTMSFRRLTVLMDSIIGEKSGVVGEDQFVGFYLNCRDLVDAFPWLPKRLSVGGEQQLIHFFHLAWLNELCKTMARVDLQEKERHEWFDIFLSSEFGARYFPSPEGGRILPHIRSFLETEKERCRSISINTATGTQNWPLAKLDFLDRLQVQLESNVSWISELPLYLFLDDYTTPIISRELQGVLNAIILKRRSAIFFKISTESANSFWPYGKNNKLLEPPHDFKLIDLATESLHQSRDEKSRLLTKIFTPRIDRHPPFVGKKLTLEHVLGKTPFSFNELAWYFRDPKLHPLSGTTKKTVYRGLDIFVGMWTSDIRMMVEVFVDMIRESNGVLTPTEHRIPDEVQNRCYKTQGGEFLTFAQSIRDPELMRRGNNKKIRGEEYGNHLKNIVEAFIKVSKHELAVGNLIDNQGTFSPVQAFRLEILDSFKTTDKARAYHEGLIRYHIFLQDWRGKSQRGMLIPRLYLNRILLPYANLTFSSHDHIRLTNDEFNYLLEEPQKFYDRWVKTRRKNNSRDSTPELPIKPR